jgi:hypothetical protein
MLTISNPIKMSNHTTSEWESELKIIRKKRNTPLKRRRLNIRKENYSRQIIFFQRLMLLRRINLTMRYCS